jgi:hypothetical protein
MISEVVRLARKIGGAMRRKKIRKAQTNGK